MNHLFTIPYRHTYQHFPYHSMLVLSGVSIIQPQVMKMLSDEDLLYHGVDA
jgi:hypothetical protein